MARSSKPGLADRLRALGEAADAASGRVDAQLVEEANSVVRRAGQRLRFSGAATVTALAGATGSGKSTLFNALAGSEVSVPGIRRPTTGQPAAVTWGDEPTSELLDWLQVPRRHHVDAYGGEAGLDGLVLLDLPDHDSVEVSHRMEVDRLVRLVDMLVWVVDPQKYADAALHDNYLVPLREYAPVMMVVLNQTDLLNREDRRRTLDDLRGLLDREGLQEVPVHAVSALTGEGMAELRAILAGRVRDKQAVADRVGVDIDRIVTRLSKASGTAQMPRVDDRTVTELDTACARAAGVPAVTEAVGQAWRRRGRGATGWPVVSWVATLRPDPLRRLHLDLGPRRRARREIESGVDATHAPTALSRTSVTSLKGVPAAQVDAALRVLADQASAGLPRGWADAVRTAARSRTGDLSDALDRAIGSTNLQMHRNRRWWSVVRVVQWILIATVLAGLAWLAADFGLLYLRMPPLPDFSWRGIPAPTALAVGGVLLGLVLGGLSRIGVEVGARRKVVTARRALLGKIDTVTRELVVHPVTDELERYEKARAALTIAAG
ncbi:GTPase [Raineyella sp. LH-20]|uniref:GTPase n=1 Tax=Raineyella sp. LH-20 TaxID=3081204 RepID=UPI002952EFA0|nr:GTPase [Raineyella sp. LH-20]WOP18554.1 GTPase [Raineyella sp. LH-20]